jgi:hypothetical protein
MAGVEVAHAGIVATMDGDLQNDPGDLANMLAKLEAEKCDAVVGVRRRRRDSFVRRLSSRIGAPRPASTRARRTATSSSTAIRSFRR